MSSSSTIGRPFSGRLRSSSRPATAEQSKDGAICSVPCTTKSQHNSNESNCSTRFCTSRTSSTSIGGHEGGDNANASSRSVDCRSGNAPRAQPESAAEYTATPRSTDKAEVTIINCDLKQGNNGDVGARSCSLTDVGLGLWNATANVPEDKRAARRRRRAEAAAAAAAAALESEETNETCGLSRAAASHAALVGGTDRTHSRGPSTRGHSGVEWITGRQPSELNTHRTRPSSSAAYFVADEFSGEPAQRAESECSLPLGPSSAESEAGAGNRKDPKIEESVQPEPSAEVVAFLDNRTSLQTVDGSGVDDQEGSKATDSVAISCEADAMCDAMPVGSITIIKRTEPANSDDRVSRECVSVSCRTDCMTPTASSAADSCVPVQPASHSERGGGADNLVAYGVDSASRLESSPRDKSVFDSATQGSPVGTGPHACLTEAEEQGEVNETSASSSKILHANASVEAPGNTKMSTNSSFTDFSTTSACSENAKQAEYSSGVCGDDAGGVDASEGPVRALGGAGSDSPLRRPRESLSVSQVASKSLLKNEKRQYAQRSLSGEDGVQDDNGETTNMPWPVFRCSSIPEEAQKVTHPGLGGAAMRDMARSAAPEAAASLCTTTGLHLTPVLHGLECLRGELLLSREEFEALQSLLHPLFYRLVPCASLNECRSGFHDRMSRIHYTCGGVGRQASVGCCPVRVHKEGKPSSRRLEQELHALQQAACAFAALPSRGSKRRREPHPRDFHNDEAEVGSATYSSSRSSGGSFCSIGTHRRDHDGTGEDGEGSKGHDVSLVREPTRRRQQSRARKLQLRLDEDIEDEEGVTDVFGGYRRNQQVRISGSEAVERSTSAHSDDDELSAVSGPTARRARGMSLHLWKRMQSFDDAVGRSSVIGNQQPLHGETQLGRGSTIREGRGGKGACMEAEAYASTTSIRGLGLCRSGSKGHRRRHFFKENGCEGFDRLERNEYSGIAEETEARLHGGRRLWGAKQKKRRGVSVSLDTRSGENHSGNRFGGGSYGSTTASCSSSLFQVSPTTDWRESCFQILQHLKRQPAARWFLSLDCDAPHCYADSSVHRVYLEDIEQKLTSFMSPRNRETIPMSKRTGRGAFTVFCERGYLHPSQWQQDVRQIFFHAFTFHPMYHEIWRDASILAAEFERCCRLVHQVNPYYPSMLKRQQYNSRAFVPGATRRSALHACGPGILKASTDTADNGRSQLPDSYMISGGSPFDLSTRTPEAHSSVGGSHFITGPGVAQPLHQRIPLIYSQQVHFSQSGPPNFCHRSAFLASGAPGTAVVAGDALREGSTALEYTPATPYLRSGCGKQHGNSRSSRALGEGGVRGKRQQHQHKVGVSEGRLGTEDVGVIRKPDGQLVYSYSAPYREMREGIPGDEGGKSSRVMATVAVGSPRRGGRGGGRGRGFMRGGRGTALGNELRGPAPLQQQPRGQYPWSSIGGHASQGPGVVSEHRFFGTIGELQQQPFASGGRMLPVGVAAGGQPARDGGLVLMGRAGVSPVTSFAAGPTVPGAGEPANVLLLSSSNVLETVQQMDAPVGAPVLPPPPVPRIGVNDKPLSSSQRRTLEQNMQRLSPLQRKAALELIQDDLGILAAEYMNVKAFAFDTELLSIEKQKRLFAYVNSMFRANREILLRQHEEQVAAAHASAVSAAADGAAEALLQPSGVRRGRRKRGEANLAGGPGEVQSRSGSSSSSSGSDSDSSSSLSSSDTSSSSSSSDTEEEESEESENEGDYCQKATTSTSDASSSVAQSAPVSGVETKNGTLQSTGVGSGRTGTAAAPYDTGSDVRGRAHFSGETPALGTWDLRRGCYGEGESDRWNEQRYTTNEIGPHRGSEVIDGVIQEKKDVGESSGMVALRRAAGGAETTIVTGTAGQLAGNPDSETAEGGRLGSSLSTPDLSSPGKCAHRENIQSEGVGLSGGEPCGLLSMHDSHADSPLESSAGPSASASACSHSVSKRRPDSCAAYSPAGDDAEITELHKGAAANGEQPTGNFLASYGATAAPKTSGGGGRSLPQYTPVCEEGARVEIRAEVMGRHADFLGVLAIREAGASENEGARVGDCNAKPTAWQEWKGQVIQQGFVAQRAYASQQQRSVSEMIAERYNARI